MNKSNLKIRLLLSLVVLLTGLMAAAQTATSPSPAPAPAPSASTATGKKAAPLKKVKIDYENETVMGTYDTPDAQFINSRRMMKFKVLFNRRTNFIDEVESNKGLFNEYQK